MAIKSPDHGNGDVMQTQSPVPTQKQRDLYHRAVREMTRSAEDYRKVHAKYAPYLTTGQNEKLYEYCQRTDQVLGNDYHEQRTSNYILDLTDYDDENMIQFPQEPVKLIDEEIAMAEMMKLYGMPAKVGTQRKPKYTGARILQFTTKEDVGTENEKPEM